MTGLWAVRATPPGCFVAYPTRAETDERAAEMATLAAEARRLHAIISYADHHGHSGVYYDVTVETVEWPGTAAEHRADIDANRAWNVARRQAEADELAAGHARSMELARRPCTQPGCDACRREAVTP